MSRMTRFVGAAVLCGLAVLQGCASSPHATASDPYESFNRKMFVFNEEMDARLLRPGAVAYRAILPDFVERSISNFTGNFKDAWSFVNLLLQGEPVAAVEEFMRVVVNSTLGLGGLLDVATDMRLDRHNEDLGQTLAVWGVPDGPYLVLPFRGPSTVRDTVALPADMYMTPSTFPADIGAQNALSVVQVLSVRSQLLGATDLLSDVALDKYAFVRDAYLQRRRNLIYNGEPPDDQGESSLRQDKQAQVQVQMQMAELWSADVLVDVSLPSFSPAAALAFGQSNEQNRDNNPAANDHADEWSQPVTLPEWPSRQLTQRVSAE